MSTGTGDACYLARDLGNGSYGGDVHCLQRFFARKGYLQEEATGYYGERTATAASRWKRDNGITDEEGGGFGLDARTRYARQCDLPEPGSSRVTAAARANEKNTCVDVCAEFTGVKDCQTRCVQDADDKKHACREACQVAFGNACDRAFPASGDDGSTNFKICLSYMATSCHDTCKKFRGVGEL